MSKSKFRRVDLYSFLSAFGFALALLVVPLTTSCSAFVRPMSDDDALKTLRELTKDGKLPPEGIVADIENRFSRSKPGALAKLLRARIRFENSDFDGAAQILDTNVFREKTKLADYALWLRGRALQSAGKHAEAMNVLMQLVRDYPTSLRARDARILWANSALQSGQVAQIPPFLQELVDRNQADALLLTAKAYETSGDQANALRFYRKTYFYGAGTNEAKEAETKLTALGQPLLPQTAEEATVRADKLNAAKNFAEAAAAYTTLAAAFPNALTADVNLRRLITFSNVKNMTEAQNAFNLIPAGAKEKEEAYYNLALGYAKNRLWANARTTAEEMRQRLPAARLTPKTWIDAGMAARDAKSKADENYFLQTAVAAFPNAVDVAKAQFELAWLQHDGKNYQLSSQMMLEHLARYVDKDSTNRGKAGYWAARDSELAGKTNEACALYDATVYRYGSNWYGYLALQRLTAMRGRGQCQSAPNFPSGSLVPKAVANLKIVTVAAETSGQKEQERIEKGEDLSVVGLFDWGIDEFKEAQKTAGNSPRVNLALAKHYRLKGDQVNALLSLAKSYPDYAQMFPEELGREEWDIFYPLTNWSDIKYWAAQRRLDPFQVAGFIRQETIFDPRAKSGANAYGLMQLLIPTARAVAKKYGSSVGAITPETLYQPAANIELGTAYIRDQFDKFGRVEYVAVAYNAGPGRVPQWTASLPAEIDEFVEAIPFKETKGYVQGIIRNSAQYRRLYDESGNFKPNVGSRPLRGEIDSKPREQFTAEFPDVDVDDNQSE
ncbi:MAG: transglycosylase SLT domain-containing protein [Acidobacteria bacterium]|nr:transglycosylase SLT domain-containing protein [Acidobacteriota bacterium]